VARPTLGAGFTAPRRAARAVGSRRANLGGGFAETRVFHGPSLRAGESVEGPAVIEESFTTIVVYPGWTAVVDDANDYALLRVEDQ